MLPGMPSCRDMTELTTDFLEGEQSLAHWAAFRMHILMCADCRRYLEQMQLTIEALHRMPDEPIADEVHAELMRRYRKWQSHRE